MRFLLALVGLFFTVLAIAQTPVKKYQGQGPVQEVDTSPRPIQQQYRNTFAFEDAGIYISNEFAGARLNGALMKEDTLMVWITPENAPINPSPWYAFKIWADEPKEALVKFTYQNAKHRYYPKLSRDGKSWQPLDSANYQEFNKGESDFGPNSLPESAMIKLSLDSDTLWVAGQELQTSEHIFAWIDSLSQQSYINHSDIGASRLGRPMRSVKISEAKRDDKIVFVFGRQHPPEVTGWLAMKAFVETITGDSKLAREFRQEYTTYVVPLMNPDGVDLGHWRHSAGGVDLNRDWSQFHHPETQAVRDFLRKKTAEGAKLYFGVDFHSTWDDIYYTLDSTVTTNTPGLMAKWLSSIENNIPDYEINEKSSVNATGVSKNFLFREFGAESLVYEVGDNTPRPFVRQKGQVAAEQLMRLLLDQK
ncbi:MAG: M14 family metallopeptidase [Tunicatimonas sp.]|uniref:M14 family metallopeptidase n=1 Tax=Tunicatimonas sp. TaxID=1940096 RepID=UPI003C72D45D